MVAKMVHRRLSNLVLAGTAPVIAASPKAQETRGREPGRGPHIARHAITDGAKPRPPASLPIRSVERRRWSADLVSSAMAGLVLHGVGGIGKSTLAAEITARVGRLEPERMITVISGEVHVDRFLAELAAALRRHPKVAARGGVPAEAVEAADRIDLSWAQRLALLREHVLGQVPVLVVLDNFDDNLSAESAEWAVHDPALASLLARWADPPHLGRLLITCRHPFALPGAAGATLGFRHLGPLSRSSAGELAKSLPTLGRLGQRDLDRAWRLLGGHPRAMEYLDALLGTGHARFPDVARRLAEAIQARTGRPISRTDPDAPTRLSSAAAKTIALVAGDLLLADLFGCLSADAQSLLIGASVYRAPVGRNVLLLPGGRCSRADGLAGLVAECEATGLLAADPGGEPPSVFVHRWTACELHRRLAETQRGDEVTDAHGRAAEYWRQRIAAWPQDRHAPLEASYHLLKAGDLARRDRPETSRPVIAVRHRLRLLGLAAMAAAVMAVVAAAATGVFSARHLASPPAPSRLGPPASQAAAVRGQAAAWVAQQVTGNAIVACDPAMCPALQAHGIAAGDLLVLRSAASDPLGSEVVIATAAVRSQFGGRLASVYAPEILASFGSGGLRIDVRAVAPDGTAAYRTALAADLAARREAGSQLLRNPRISVSAAARRELIAGQVDSRLLMTLAAVASAEPVQVTAFGDAGPGASAGMPLRAIEVTVTARATGLRNMLAFVRAQRPPYLPAHAGIVRGAGGTSVLSIEFAAPSPVGLLQTQPVR